MILQLPVISSSRDDDLEEGIVDSNSQNGNFENDYFSNFVILYSF